MKRPGCVWQQAAATLYPAGERERGRQLKKSSATHWNAAVGVPYKPWWRVVCLCVRARNTGWAPDMQPGGGSVCSCERVCVWGAVSAWEHPRLGLIKPAATGSPWLGWQTYRVSTQRAHPHLSSSPWVAHHDTKANAARASMKMCPVLVWDLELMWGFFCFLENIYLFSIYLFF